MKPYHPKPKNFGVFVVIANREGISNKYTGPRPSFIEKFKMLFGGRYYTVTPLWKDDSNRNKLKNYAGFTKFIGDTTVLGLRFPNLKMATQAMVSDGTRLMEENWVVMEHKRFKSKRISLQFLHKEGYIPYLSLISELDKEINESD